MCVSVVPAVGVAVLEVVHGVRLLVATTCHAESPPGAPDASSMDTTPAGDAAPDHPPLGPATTPTITTSSSNNSRTTVRR